MSDITFLDEEQVFGDNSLDIFKKYGTKSAITDFSILLGCYVCDYIFTSEGKSLKDRTGCYWTKTEYGGDGARVINTSGDSGYRTVNARSVGSRLVLPYSTIKEVSTNVIVGSSGVKEVQYGEYPQTVVNKEIEQELEMLYIANELVMTSKKYTTDSRKNNDYREYFKPRTFQEYEYNGQKYVRFVCNNSFNEKNLSDGREIKEGEIYWLQVEPIIWQVDENNNVAVTKKILFSGVQFNNKKNYIDGFENTDIKRFIDKCFAKEILTKTISNDNTNDKEEKEGLQNMNANNENTIYCKLYIECYNYLINIVEMSKNLIYPNQYFFDRIDLSLPIEEQLAFIKRDLESISFENEVPHYLFEMLEFFYPSSDDDFSPVMLDINRFRAQLFSIKTELGDRYIPFVKLAEIRRYKRDKDQENISDEDAWRIILASEYDVEDIENTLNDIMWALYRSTNNEIIDASLQDHYKLNDIEFTRYITGFANGYSSIKRVVEKNDDVLTVDFKNFYKYFEDIYGQEETIEKIRKTLLRNILFYNAKDVDENKVSKNKGPLATFMFYGPTGTGKTETAKQIAKFVFGNDKKLLILDMNSYKDSKVASSSLKGHPEGYVDSSKGTDFTRFLKKNDKGIVVLDEFEKSANEVRELFMNMLDEGTFKDALGNKYDLSGYIFIATTNVSKVFENRPRKIGFNLSDSIEEKKDEESRIKDELRNIFTAPIMNRFNEVLGFEEIKKKDAILICKNLISKLTNKFEGKIFNGINPKIRIENIDEVVEIILKESNFKKDGVRSLKNVIDDLIGSQVLEEIVDGNDKILVSTHDGKIIFKTQGMDISQPIKSRIK